MDVIISNTSGKPIYQQICGQIREAIFSGKLAAGDLLPSIRALARDLQISVITTKRAYDELEREGFIDTVAGKGCFVAGKNMELARENSLREVEEHLLAAIRLARQCGMSEELDAMLHLLQEEEKE